MRFEALRETLLKGGVAPRHARRYLAELSDHLDDLTAQQRQAGYEGEDAALRARARLGDDQELAAAMLEQKQFRSIAVRAPWLVFGILPPALTIAAAFALIAPLAFAAWALGLVNHGHMRAPDWFRTWAYATGGIGNFMLPVAVAAVFVVLALRQRLSHAWPLVAIILISVVDLQFRVLFPASGQPGGTVSLGGTLWLLLPGGMLFPLVALGAILDGSIAEPNSAFRDPEQWPNERDPGQFMPRSLDEQERSYDAWRKDHPTPRQENAKKTN